MSLEVDWRPQLPPVKNQGACGSSYAFAAVATLEAQLARKTGKVVTLAEQELVDCTKNYGNDGCNGGNITGCFDYVKRVGGLSTERDYPYTATDNRGCRTPSARTARISSYVNVRGSEPLRDAVKTVGPVTAHVFAGERAFQMYSGGIFHGSSTPGDSDHHVAVVGYGNEDGQFYWLIRNSWGATWGDSGYMRLAETSSRVLDRCYYPLLA